MTCDPGVTEWKSPSTCANVARDAGNIAWTNPGNAQASDDSRAIADLGAFGAVPQDYSQWLRCTNFGFTTDDIPPNSTIVGIEVQVERHTETSGAVETYELYLRDSSGQVGDDKGNTTDWPTSDGTATHGGSTDDWSAGLSDSDIRDSDFGMDLCAWNNVPATTAEARVDHVQIRVHYCSYSQNYVRSLDASYHESLSSYTAPTTDSNRVLMFSVGWEETGGTNSISGVTFGGVSMTNLILDDYSYGGNSTGLGIYYMKESDIPSGSQNFVITWTGGTPTGHLVAAATFGGVHQTNTFVDYDYNEGFQPDPLEVTSNVVEYGCTLAATSNGAIGSIIWGNDWTEESDQVDANFTFSVAEHYQESDGTDTASADFQGTPYRFLLGLASLRPAS